GRDCRGTHATPRNLEAGSTRETLRARARCTPWHASTETPRSGRASRPPEDIFSPEIDTQPKALHSAGEIIDQPWPSLPRPNPGDRSPGKSLQRSPANPGCPSGRGPPDTVPRP